MREIGSVGPSKLTGNIRSEGLVRSVDLINIEWEDRDVHRGRAAISACRALRELRSESDGSASPEKNEQRKRGALGSDTA